MQSVLVDRPDHGSTLALDRDVSGPAQGPVHRIGLILWVVVHGNAHKIESICGFSWASRLYL